MRSGEGKHVRNFHRPSLGHSPITSSIHVLLFLYRYFCHALPVTFNKHLQLYLSCISHFPLSLPCTSRCHHSTFSNIFPRHFPKYFLGATQLFLFHVFHSILGKISFYFLLCLMFLLHIFYYILFVILVTLVLHITISHHFPRYVCASHIYIYIIFVLKTLLVHFAKFYHTAGKLLKLTPLSQSFQTRGLITKLLKKIKSLAIFLCKCHNLV